MRALPAPQPGPLDRALAWTLALSALACLAYAVRYQYVCWTYPYTLIYNEISTLQHVLLERQGLDPWAADLHPWAVQIYGLVWPKLVALACGLGLGCGLGLMRLLSSLCLAGSDLILYRAVRKAGSSPSLALGWTALFHLGQLHFNGATARADNGAVLLYLLGWLLPWTAGYKPWSLLVGVVASVLAALTKPYLGLAGPLLVAGLALHRGFGPALTWGAAWALGLAWSTAWVWARHDTYAYSTVLWSIQAATHDPLWMLTQLGWWGQWFVGPALLMLALAWRGPWRFDAGLLSPAVAAGTGLVLFVAALGWHIRTTLTYLHHLVSPGAIVLGAAASLPQAWRKRIAALALAAGLPLAAYAGVDRDLLRNLQGYRAFWHAQEKLIEGKRQVLAPAEWAPLLWARGLPVHETGDTECGDLGPAPSLLKPLFPRQAELQARHHSFMEERYRQAAAGAFDLVICNDEDPELIRALAKHYKRGDKLATPWYFRAWPPEPTVWEKR